MYNLYAVKLLFESTVSPVISSGKIFEECIVLIQTDDQGAIPKLIEKQFPPSTYENAEGTMTTKTLVKILDIYELVDDLTTSLQYKEVYSRHLIFGEEVSSKEVISTYKLDQ